MGFGMGVKKKKKLSRIFILLGFDILPEAL